MEANNQNSISEGKSTAIIAYVTLIGLIIAFVQNSEKKNTFAAYHIRQSLGLLCTSFALAMVNVVPILGWIVSILGMCILIVLWISGLMNALNGREKPIPMLGNLYTQWFSGIQ